MVFGRYGHSQGYRKGMAKHQEINILRSEGPGARVASLQTSESWGHGEAIHEEAVATKAGPWVGQMS